MVKSLNQGLRPISLHLISKRIKEILTQNTNTMRNIYPDLMMKLFQEIMKKIYINSLQISAVCIHMHATFPVLEIADKFQEQALKG